MVVLQPVSTATLGGLPAEEGRLIYDSTTKTLKYNNGVVDSELTTASLVGPVGINTSNPDRTLEINATNGQVLRLTYNDTDGSATNYVDFNVTASGDLSLDASGNDILTASSDNLDIQSHDGSTKGLKLNGTLVTSTASELNYVDVTPGTAEASKALVLDGTSDISGINELHATDLYGAIQTASQTVITDVGTLTNLNVAGSIDIYGWNGTTGGLKFDGDLITSSAAELNYLDGSTQGTAVANTAMVTDGTNSITGLGDVTANNFYGTLQTSNQSAITTIGTLTSLSVENSISLLVSSGVGNTTLYPATITRETTTTPANGLGVGMNFSVENSANVDTVFGTVSVRADDITSTSEDGLFSIALRAGGTLTSDLFKLDSTGQITATRLVESSDRRIKTDIVDADEDDSLEKIMNLQIKNYRYTKNPEVLHRGVIAQELKEVIPSAVIVHEKDDIADFHSISNSEMLSYLIQAVQKLNKKIDACHNC